MASDHAPYRLREEILALSVAGNWDAARREWSLERVFFAPSDEPGQCLCGHFPIIEHCVIRNWENGNEAVVGNVCVTKFLKLPSEKIFAGLRRIATDPEAALNRAAVEYASGQGYIREWEKNFLLDTAGKRRLSAKQRNKRREINSLILHLISRQRGVNDA